MPDIAKHPTIEPPAWKRTLLSILALGGGYLAGIGVERLLRYLFLFGSEWKFTLYWFAVLSIFGWLVVGLPFFVFGPRRNKLCIEPNRTAVLGGLGGIFLLLSFLLLPSAFGGFHLDKLMIEFVGFYSACAFVIGFTATRIYIELLTTANYIRVRKYSAVTPPDGGCEGA